MAAEIRAILADPAKFAEVTSEVFDAADTDGSGQVSKTELRAALRTIAEDSGLPLPTEEDVDKTLAALDTDQSGSLSKEEFQVLVRAALEAFAEVLG
mmetsp:Transcript_34125/g.59545  ORF Transcript_34125/g.59545 Transcript_34125/m.59545 type:complete len:97 (-) Transcript_34125:1854-2144(-)|eukprot:CAMPEP_0204901754 /NCGR_PEP_ID=MMETSP1397-20131031/3258_1 /ASSEMBLY_ACC=CAM_ASM_000891 /TAXON_ID=49980 /ORGANISM="Climacostomum Climacostomum virens, Strain Stock W-24" /LENGTH=96 /DNA_ID=CAMNT_0052070155 /DNA_START=8 /DNA_END=298 /DNA_ORIENTATION=-